MYNWLLSEVATAVCQARCLASCHAAVLAINLPLCHVSLHMALLSCLCTCKPPLCCRANPSYCFSMRALFASLACQSGCISAVHICDLLGATGTGGGCGPDNFVQTKRQNLLRFAFYALLYRLAHAILAVHMQSWRCTCGLSNHH